MRVIFCVAMAFVAMCVMSFAVRADAGSVADKITIACTEGSVAVTELQGNKYPWEVVDYRSAMKSCKTPTGLVHGEYVMLHADGSGFRGSASIDEKGKGLDRFISWTSDGVVNFSETYDDKHRRKSLEYILPDGSSKLVQNVQQFGEQGTSLWWKPTMASESMYKNGTVVATRVMTDGKKYGPWTE